MLYTLITFVGLFIVSTALAIIFYVNVEEQKDSVEKSTADLDLVLNSREQIKGLENIVGKLPEGKSGIGAMLTYLDELVLHITGSPLGDPTAKMKVETVNTKIQDTLDSLPDEYLNIKNIEPNSLGLTRVIEKLKLKLDLLSQAKTNLTKDLEQLESKFDIAMKETQKKEKKLLGEKEEYRQQVVNIKVKYDELAELMKQNADEQVNNLAARLEEERTSNESLRNDLLEARAQRDSIQQKMEATRKELVDIKPLPNSEVSAFEPDGEIVLVDDQTRIVHINIGSDDRVYHGLTFGVYDRSTPIPRDGRGKAEVEVFEVKEKVSAARITSPINVKRPIVQGDNIANLIWDSNKINRFIIVGDFDLNQDGVTDDYAANKVKLLIKEWGGKVANEISIETDYIILGRAPRIHKKPTFEDMEMYPLALEKYEESVKKGEEYQKVLKQAEFLKIPVFNYERFLYFIGYKLKAKEPGAF
jgi:hypothetical protein